MKRTIAILACLGVVVFGVWFVFFHKPSSEAEGAADSITSSSADDTAAFPGIDTTTLTSVQKRILTVAQVEYNKHAQSYDDTVLKYTEGYEESWCVDFASWVMNEADTPFVHPETGYWRIPGVLTLQAYYEQYNAYFEVDDYTPVLGDIAFYIGETPDGDSEEHVAIVLAVNGDMLTTIGGNEGDEGIVQIRTDTLKAGEKGLVGFGRS